MSTVTSEFLGGLSLAPPPRSRGRPPRDVRVEHLEGATLLFNIMVQGVPYAGDAENPRPLRHRTLYDVKKWIGDRFPSAKFRRAFPATTLHFAFCHDRMKMPVAQAIPVPREDLWWLAASGDILLLSDRRTHHYTSVLSVDDDAGVIRLLDPWPDRIFLKKGLNTARVEAVVESVGEEAKRVNITRDEFMRVAAGLITKDTPELIDHYLAYRPAGREDVRLQLAFGYALLEEEEYALAPFAAVCLTRALRLAEVTSPRTGQVEDAAARLYFALVSSIYYQRRCGEPLATKPFEADLRHLLGQYAEDRLLASARVEELCSLGHAAGAAKDYAAARRFLDPAVARFPNSDEPLRLRAKARFLTGDHVGALDDATQALVLNAGRIRELEEQQAKWHLLDRYSREHDQERIGGLRNRRAEELDIRAGALRALGRSSVVSDAQEGVAVPTQHEEARR